MAEYKDVEPLKKQIADFKRAVKSENSDYLTGYISALSAVEGMIAGQPAADVAPVKHAKWAYGKLHGQSGYYCSECGAGFADINPNAELIAKSHDYCPKCGAKMDGGEGE